MTRRLHHYTREILMGKSLRLKHGWVAVVNRGQADINKRMTMNDARAREIDFFRSTDAYRWVLLRGTPPMTADT